VRSRAARENGAARARVRVRRARGPRQASRKGRTPASRGGRGRGPPAAPRGGGPHAAKGKDGGPRRRTEGQGRGPHARGERRGGRERGEGWGSSPWDPTIGDNRPPDHLGQRGGREVEERERELLRGKPNERERGGAWGVWGRQGGQAMGGARLGWVASRAENPQHARPLIENQLRIKILK
jgi:hypothetical protein